MADNDDATDDADAKCNGSRNSSISSEEMTAFFGLRVSIITMKMLNTNNTVGTVRTGATEKSLHAKNELLTAETVVLRSR